MPGCALWSRSTAPRKRASAALSIRYEARSTSSGPRAAWRTASTARLASGSCRTEASRSVRRPSRSLASRYSRPLAATGRAADRLRGGRLLAALLHRAHADLDPAAHPLERPQELLLACREQLAQRVVVRQPAAEAHGQHGAVDHDPLDHALVHPQRVERGVAGRMGVAADHGQQVALAHAVERSLREAAPARRRELGAIADPVDPDHANGVPLAGGSDMPSSSAVATEVISARSPT